MHIVIRWHFHLFVSSRNQQKSEKRKKNYSIAEEPAFELVKTFHSKCDDPIFSNQSGNKKQMLKRKNSKQLLGIQSSRASEWTEITYREGHWT